MIKDRDRICPICGGEVRHRDFVSRGVKTKNGERYAIKIERVVCDNRHYHRVIPDNLIPGKHYEKELIFGVLEGFITCETLGYEDYPCEATMKLWWSQFKHLL